MTTPEEKKEKAKLRSKIWYEKNKDKKKKYQKDNKEKIKKDKQKYWENNKEKLYSYKIEHHKKSLLDENSFNYNNKYYKEYSKKNKKDYYINNKEKIKEYSRNRHKELIATNPMFKLKKNIRTLIGDAFRKNSLLKKSKTTQILGCSFDDFKVYIESKFESWMTWENRGLYNGELNYGWDLDHIIPISTAKTEEDIIRLSHFTNFQPLCSYTNRFLKKDK